MKVECTELTHEASSMHEQETAREMRHALLQTMYMNHKLQDIDELITDFMQLVLR